MLGALLLALPRGASGGAGAASDASLATNWALASRGATATANSAGYWAGYTAEARFALDGDTHTFWSSTGGAVCCSETQKAWLLVDLGAVRPMATLQLLVRQDLAYTLAFANASAGPFVTAARRACAVCQQNSDLLETGTRMETFALGGAAAAARFVRLQVTWSSHGGIGGCEDICDWATNVYELRAYSPGRLPAEAVDGDAVAPPPPDAALQPGCPRHVVPLVVQDDVSRVRLSGDAARQPRGDGVRGAEWMSLTGANQAHRSGTAEFSRVVRPLEDCGCVNRNFLLLTMYVRLGGGTSMPGEGLAISLVDARRQTPGATRFMAGCGTRPALPADAVSVVLDTSDSDPACDEPGTGVRAVSTLQEGATKPLLLGNTLDMRTSSFRNGRWVPIQFEIENANVHHSTSLNPDGTWVSVQRVDDTVDLFAPFHIWVDGVMMVDASILYGQHATELRRSNASLDAFYIVLSARTGALSSDGHAISGLKVECRPAALTATFVENWDGTRQPLPASPPPLAPMPPPSPPWTTVAMQQGTSAQLASASFAVAFFCATLAIGCAFILRRSVQRSRRIALLSTDDDAKAHALADEEALLLGADAAPEVRPIKPEPGALVAVPVTPVPYLILPDPAALDDDVDGFDVFLSYRRVDHRLADAVHDKLRLCGLRVFKDIEGRMAGTPFGSELIRAIRTATVFAPVVTLPSLQRMSVAADDAAEVDTTLGECLAALYFRSTGHVRLIHPLLAGDPQEPQEHGVSKRPAAWASLVKGQSYHDALAALPDAVPVATIASVSSSMRSAFGLELPPEFLALTVRDIMIGRTGADPQPGVLTGTSFAVECLPDELGLYIRDRYAPLVLSAVADVAAERRQQRQARIST